jgi:uncharacterized protein YciI
MKKLNSILLLLALATISYSQEQPAQPQKPAENPALQLQEFQMAILSRGPKWTPNFGKNSPEIQQKHIEYVESLISTGKAMIAGAIKDDSTRVAVYIFRTKSAEEAQGWVNSDPAIVNGFVVAELHPWWSADVMKKIEAPKKLMTAYLEFLVRGEKWTPERTPQTAEIQKGHMANIQRLAEMKKLVVAGPFGDNGRLRGIFVFRVDSIEEAKALTLTDPAIQSGRLALELHPWLVPEGILP